MKTETLDDARMVISDMTETCQELSRANAKLRELLSDVLHGSGDQKLTAHEGPSLEPSLRAEIRSALKSQFPGSSVEKTEPSGFQLIHLIIELWCCIETARDMAASFRSEHSEKRARKVLKEFFDAHTL